MAYEPYTWSDGDAITALRLNHMEEGISTGAKKLGIPIVVITTTNASSNSRTVLWWYYAHKQNGAYTLGYYWFSNWISYLSGGNHTFILPAPIPISELDDVCVLVTTGSSGVTITSMSGGVSTTPISINGTYFYEVTGDFRISISG